MRGVCYGYGAFGHFSRECSIRGVVVPITQSVQPIRAVLPPGRGGMHGRWGCLQGALEVLRQLGKKIDQESIQVEGMVSCMTYLLVLRQSLRMLLLQVKF